MSDASGPTRPKPTSPAGAKRRRPAYDQPEHRVLRDGLLRAVQGQRRRPSHTCNEVAQRRCDPFKATPRVVDAAADCRIPLATVLAEILPAFRDAVVRRYEQRAA